MRHPANAAAATLGLVLSLSLLGAPPAGALLIDDFEAGDFLVTDDTTTGSATFAPEQTGLAGTVGGVRLASVRALTLQMTGNLTTTAGDDGALFTAIPDGNANLYYDGNIGLPNPAGTGGALNLDLSGFPFIAMEAVPSSLSLTGQLRLASSSTIQFGPTIALGVGTNLFPLAGYTLDLEDIQQIHIFMTGFDLGATLQVSNIEAIPEPASGALLALGLVTLAARRRRCA